MNNYDIFNNKKKECVNGYAQTKFTNSYVFYPKNIDECISILESSKKKGFKICCRGGGFSYADIITNSDNVILDFTLMNIILFWDEEIGIMTVQPGATFGQIINISFLSNWILSSCPGSMDITIGGAVSNNVHGKDCYKYGNFGKQVLELKILLASGKIIKASSKQNVDLFNNVVGGMGLIGIIIEIKLQLKRIPSPFVKVNNKISKNLFDSIDYIEKMKNNSDFIIAWVDSFSKNNSIGRGYINSSKWTESNEKVNLKELNNTLVKSKNIFGILPAKKTWYIVRPLFKPIVIKKLNFINFNFHKINNLINLNQNKKLIFTKYNFIHNKIPDIKEVFKPHGFLEFQPLLPLKNIEQNLKQLIILCQKFHFESLLCGLKAHSPDEYPLSFEKDGYSIGISIQLNGRKKEDILNFSKEIFSFIADCNGKIYLAKDELLNKFYFQKMYPKFSSFLNVKNKYDPDCVFYSDLYKRLF